TVGFNPPSGSTFAKGTTTTVTATATDSAGNHASCTFTVKVNDTEAPKVTCFPNLSPVVDLSSCKVWTPTDDEVAALFGATAADNCDGTLPATFVSRSDGKALGAPFPTGTTTIVWGATDGAGNTGTCSQHVQVSAPNSWTLACPGTYTIWV